jgi:hemerythrin superfamily protein
MSLIDTLKGRSKHRAFPFSPGAEEEGDADILDTLKKDHEEVAAMLSQLVKSENRAERKSLLKKIKAALVPHLRAEEKVVYNAIYSLKDKEAQQDSSEGYMEHQLGDKTLATLEKIPNTISPEFSAGAKVLKELVEHHVEEEEKNVWKDVREHFSTDERVAMNRKFLAAKKKIHIG